MVPPHRIELRSGVYKTPASPQCFGGKRRRLYGKRKRLKNIPVLQPLYLILEIKAPIRNSIYVALPHRYGMSQLDVSQLRNQIQTVLTPANLYSANAEELLIATCAQESLMGTYRTQAPHGPARGIFECEGATFQDLVNNYLKYHPSLLEWAQSLSTDFGVDDLVHNDNLAIAICRLHYYRVPAALPDKNDLDALWTFYKLHYNTPSGAATQEEFTNHYNQLVVG
jgi:hypothetical protein